MQGARAYAGLQPVHLGVVLRDDDPELRLPDARHEGMSKGLQTNPATKPTEDQSGSPAPVPSKPVHSLAVSL